MADPELALAFRILFLLLAPLVLGFASSTALRAALWSAFALYLVPAVSFSWQMLYALMASTPLPEQPTFAHLARVMLGSAAVGAILGLIFYATKRAFQKVWAMVSPGR